MRKEKKAVKKLSLHRETLQFLAEAPLQQVAGGSGTRTVYTWCDYATCYVQPLD